MAEQSSQGGSGEPGGGATQGGSMTVEQIDRGARAENPNTRGHSPARDAREAAAGRPVGPQQGGDQGDQQQQQPAGGEKIKIDDVEISPDEFKKIMARQGAEDARRLTLPKDANGYELKVSESFKPPAGVKFEFNKDDPMLAQYRAIALKRGFDQQTFSEGLDLIAGMRIAEMTKINSAREAEIQKLGAMGTQRIDAIKTFLHGTLGSELGGALELMLCTDRQVRGFEKIMARMSNQGATQFENRGREQQQEQAGKIPGYKDMTFEQRRVAQMGLGQQARTNRDSR